MSGQRQERTYPEGVPCWIDTEQPDPRAAMDFYARLLGWEFHRAAPSAPYWIAALGDSDVAAISPAGDTASWNTYVAVTDADATVSAVRAAGGHVLQAAADTGPAGRMAVCTDPDGAQFRLWQAGRRPGAQAVNVPGAWNFSHLHVTGAGTVKDFYTAVFGWAYDDVAGTGGASIRVPGYGEHLAATIDPGIRERQATAPPGFADVIGGIHPVSAGSTHWHVTISVDDRDASAATAESLGATVSSTYESAWAAFADICDPQGAELTLSQFKAPS